MRKTRNRSHLLPRNRSPDRGREGRKYSSLAGTPHAISTEKSIPRAAAMEPTGSAAAVQVTVSATPLAGVSLKGPMVHSKEDNKKRNPTAMINPLFTYLCVKITGRCKILFSKATIRSNNPTKKVNRLERMFPLRLLVGKISRRTICHANNRMSSRKTRMF